MKIRSHELAWAAGFFDGEGCVRFGISSRTYYRVALSVPQNHPGLLRRFRRAVGGRNRIYGPYHRKPSKPIYMWMATGLADIVRIERLLRPYLGPIKRKQFRTTIRHARRYIAQTGRKL